MKYNFAVVKEAIKAMIESEEFDEILIKYLESKENISVEGLEIKSGGSREGIYIEIK